MIRRADIGRGFYVAMAITLISLTSQIVVDLELRRERREHIPDGAMLYGVLHSSGALWFGCALLGSMLAYVWAPALGLWIIFKRRTWWPLFVLDLVLLISLLIESLT